MLRRAIEVYWDGVTVFIDAALDFCCYGVDAKVLPLFRTNHRLNCAGSYQQLGHAYGKLIRFAALPLLVSTLFTHWLGDRLYIGSCFTLIYLAIAHTVLTLSVYQQLREFTAESDSAAEDDVQQTPPFITRFVKPISDMTRYYLISALYYGVTNYILLRSSYLHIRSFGHILWMTFWVGVTSCPDRALDLRLDHYHRHWIWFFGLATIPACATAYAARWPLVVTSLWFPILVHAALVNKPRAVKRPGDLNADTRLKENSPVAPPADTEKLNYLEEICLRFRWSAWAVDTVAWILEQFNPSSKL